MAVLRLWPAAVLLVLAGCSGGNRAEVSGSVSLNGEPIAEGSINFIPVEGNEGAGAAGVGLRYGRGNLRLKNRSGTTPVYWQGPSLGFDAGGNAARVFTLVYRLRRVDDIFHRYPGVDGSAYFVGGVGVNYQERDNVVLAPIRAGVGLRLGANIGYLHYSRRRRILPF